MNYSGYICIHRKILTDAEYFEGKFDRIRCWLDILLMAEWKDGSTVEIRGQTIALKRGELAISLRELSMRWNLSVNTVKQRLIDMQNQGMIDTRKTNLTTLISVVNYDKYQIIDTRNDAKTDTRIDTQSKEKKQKKDGILLNKDTQSLFNNIPLEKEKKHSNAVNACEARSALRDSFFKRLAEDLEVRKDICDEFGFRDLKVVATYLGGFMGHILTRQPNKKWKDFNDFVKHCKNWIGKQNEAGAKENLKAYRKWLKEQKPKQ